MDLAEGTKWFVIMLSASMLQTLQTYIGQKIYKLSKEIFRRYTKYE
jgi:hypothetical protein